MTSPTGLNGTFLVPRVDRNCTPEPSPKAGSSNWNAQAHTPRKSPQREGALGFEILKTHRLFHHSQKVMDADIDQLKAAYAFRSAHLVKAFLTNHPSISATLTAAVPHLKEHFGSERILNLEVTADDDSFQTLYAIVVWDNTVASAARALEGFTENWWLDHMTPATSDLAFTYELI